MVETKWYCDICGKEINKRGIRTFYNLHSNKAFAVDGYNLIGMHYEKRDLLICDDCWADIREFCKARRNK